MASAPYRLVMIHSVPDYERWRAGLSENPAQHRPGLVRRAVFRAIDDPSEVMIEIEFESAEAATAFLPSLDLAALFERTGVELYPPVFIGEEIEDLRFELT